jgi:UDP-3-O-[3-hydroxymyristoyl] N-acetylglucosamine deacetylase
VGSKAVLRGTALHRGGPAEVSLSRHDGLVVFARGAAVARLDELVPVRTDRGVMVASADGRLRVDLVEHLLAAVGGLGVQSGLRIEVMGEELPLLGGGAKEFADALACLDLPKGRALRVTREATLEHGRARYRFAPGSSTSVRVVIDFPPPVGRQTAAWDGDPEDFRARIAPARTFGWAHEAEALRAAGRAASVDLASVIVFTEHGVVDGCRPPADDEPARHKLLDVIGDMTLHGGPPVGVVECFAPGHTASHAVFAEARATGILV